MPKWIFSAVMTKSSRLSKRMAKEIHPLAIKYLDSIILKKEAWIIIQSAFGLWLAHNLNGWV